MRWWAVTLALSAALDVSQCWIAPAARTAGRCDTSCTTAGRRRGSWHSSSTPRVSLLSSSPSPSHESRNQGDKSTPSPSRSSLGTVPRRRLQVAGVSVSPSGFHIILQVNASHYLPLRVTDDAMDATSASSPQALTILQLLARVDMAGAILPPDTLAKIVVLTLEAETGGDEDLPVGSSRRAPLPSSTPVGAKFLEHVQERIRKLEYTNATTYTELHSYPWLQSRVTLPMVTMDELVISPRPSSPSSPSTSAAMSYKLVCSVKNLKVGSALTVELTESVCEDVSYEYRPNGISMAFVAAALALRYRAPIELSLAGEGNDGDATVSPFLSFVTLEKIREAFPLYRTAAQLQQTTERVTSNIEKGLKVNQLQAALRMALQKEDFAAATKIRRALDEMDSLSDLPTQPESDTDSMQ